MNSDRLLALFFELVRIESPSRFEGNMAKRCQRELEELGFSVSYDDSASRTNSEVGNLIATRNGELEGCVILSAHLDTVPPCQGIEPVLDNGVIRSAGPTILSADDKAGIAAIFEGLRSLIEGGTPLPTVVVLFTTCEELSLVGSGALSADLLPKDAPCYVFDADGAPGTIILGAPCHHTLKATFKGRAAHAGVEPENGNSAIQMAARAIAAMNLGRLDDVSTANIGVLAGGRQVNVIPDSCVVEGECRSVEPERAEAQKRHMSAALEEAAQWYGGSVDIAWSHDYAAIRYDENDAMVQGICEAAQRAGLEARMQFSGGGSDANKLATYGVKAITLGIGMTNFHSVDEYITVDDLEGCTRLVIELLQQTERK